MGMGVKPALVFRRAIQLHQHLDRAVMMIVIVMSGRQPSCVQAHAQARIEFRMVGDSGTDLCRLFETAPQPSRGLFRQLVDLV